MRIDVVMLPSELTTRHLRGRAVAVFDVLRATTTMTAALAAGVAEIRLFADIEAARSAAAAHAGKRLLVGEVRCLPPEGFELGNSPGAFNRDLHAGTTMFMCTTNGTRALLAASEAEAVFAASLVNCRAVAHRLSDTRRDITLLCAGTDGKPALEDLAGAGSVIDALMSSGESVDLESDIARCALAVFCACREDLVGALRVSQGGRNVIAAGLPQDVDFAARINTLTNVGRLAPSADVPTLRPAWPPAGDTTAET